VRLQRYYHGFKTEKLGIHDYKSINLPKPPTPSASLRLSFEKAFGVSVEEQLVYEDSVPQLVATLGQVPIRILTESNTIDGCEGANLLPNGVE